MKPKTALKQCENTFIFNSRTSLSFFVLFIYFPSIYILVASLFVGLYAVLDYGSILDWKKEIDQEEGEKEWLQSIKRHQYWCKWHLKTTSILFLILIGCCYYNEQYLCIVIGTFIIINMVFMIIDYLVIKRKQFNLNKI